MQKFIITQDGTFKYGNVRLHKDLLSAGEICYGGGFYEFDYIAGRLLLSGRSFDFGKPQWNFIESLKMPSAFRGLSITYENIDITNYVKLEW